MPLKSRDRQTTQTLLDSIKDAVVGRFQITTDGFGTYTNGIPMTFGNQCDFAQLVKNYESSQTETRYSPAKIISTEKTIRFGNPDPAKICTSHIERVNLTIRMQCRRFTRLTNAHSNVRHHTAMQAILVAYYNFCRKHETIKTTPAVASGLASKPWSIRELLERVAG
jgi:IS1 family transposase